MAVEVEHARRLFTVEEYLRMAEAGVFRPDERIELIDGEIIQMSPVGYRHSGCVMSLNRLLVLGVGNRAAVLPGGSVVIGPRSMPEPDLALLRVRPVPYIKAHARERDILLVIEVADSSLRFDRTVKLRLYARAAIPEYWLVDANAECVHVHRAPAHDGYGEVRRVGRGGVVAPQALSDVALDVDQIFA